MRISHKNNIKIGPKKLIVDNITDITCEDVLAFSDENEDLKNEVIFLKNSKCLT